MEKSSHLIYIRIDGITYLGKLSVTTTTIADSPLSLEVFQKGSTITLHDPVIVEMISVPTQNKLTGEGQINTLTQLIHLRLDRIFVSLGSSFTYGFYDLDDNLNPMVNLYNNSWQEIKKQEKKGTGGTKILQ